jgi:hypothetical protein
VVDKALSDDSTISASMEQMTFSLRPPCKNQPALPVVDGEQPGRRYGGPGGSVVSPTDPPPYSFLR